MVMSVLITGANRGIGLSLSNAYAHAGHKVIACCRNPQHATDLNALGVDVRALDVSDQTSINALKEQLGDIPIDILINNAGVDGGNHQSFDDIDYAAWETTLMINMIAPYRMVEAFADNIAASDRKCVANISSQMGSITQYGDDEDFIYRSSKTALNMVTLNLSIDLKPRGITFLSIHPGWVQTDMGGSNAPVLPAISAEGIATVIENATPDMSGGFFAYDGTELPW